MRCKQNNEFNNSLATDQQKEVDENLEEEPEEFGTPTIEQLRLQRICFSAKKIN